MLSLMLSLVSLTHRYKKVTDSVELPASLVHHLGKKYLAFCGWCCCFDHIHRPTQQVR